MKRQLLPLAAMCFCLQFFSACKSGNETEAEEQVTEVPVAQDSLIAQFYTSMGKMEALLYFEKTPLTAANFVGLAEGSIETTTIDSGKAFFDGLQFHRIIEKFMIQGGDPLGNGSGGPGYSFPDEIVPDLSHKDKGVLAMANAGPNTNGSQFYITLAAQPALDGGYTVFGHLINGYEVLDKIGSVRTEGPPMDKPLEKVSIDSIRIRRVGAKAIAFDAARTFNENMAEIKKQNEAKIKEAQESFGKLIVEKYPDAKKTASGLHYIITNPGSGKPKNGQWVVVDYRGSLVDGTIFDQSYGKQPIRFQLGVGQVIPGWDEGLKLFGKGGKGKLIVPYQLGYGDRGSGQIPAFANLIFDIDLLDVQNAPANP